MTDTDDTDDLLLIPPDFFSVKSDSESSDTIQPYYSIVDNLIKQVGNLQNRISSIESSESFFSNSLEYSFEKSHSCSMQNSTKGFRKCNSTDELYDSKTSSLEYSPNFKVNSMPNTPYLDRFTGKSPQKARPPFRHTVSPKRERKPFERDEGNRTLNEIDTFLSKVKTIQRLNAVRNLESEFDDCSLEKPSKEKTTWRCGDNSSSVPDLGAGVKSTLYKHEPVVETVLNERYYSTESSLMNDSLTSVDHYPTSESSTDSTQVTAYKKSDTNLSNPIHTNAINVLNRHKKLVEDSANKVKEVKSRSANSLSDNLGLVNLADIWKNNTLLDPSQAKQKLQEERLRRQHCENLIQELQNRNLELQQKLSVAVQVDDTKNKVINQFQEALEKVVAKMKTIQREKKDWEKEMSVLKNKHRSEMEDMSQKISYYEKELSRALSLVKTNQEKCTSFEQKFQDLQNELQFVEKKYKDCEDILKKETDRNKQLTEILSQKEIEINENKSVVNSARAEVSKSKQAIESCQEEFLSLKSEHAKLQESFDAEQKKVVALENELKGVTKEKEDYKKREDFLQDEIIKIKKQLESKKHELRSYYQGQVEILVQNKLKEFQAQLEQTEATFKDEMKKREMSIAKSAAAHIQQISDKYTLEIKLLEKKHQEELKLYRVQLMQEKQQVENLQIKIDQFQHKRVHIAKQLQKIMETQWTEALRIIASGKSPTLQDSFSTIDQLNSLKSRSCSNVEEVLAQQAEPIDLNGIEKDIGGGGESVAIIDTPISARAQQPPKAQEFSEDEVQKYINLFLNKPANNANSDEFSKMIDRFMNEERDSTFATADRGDLQAMSMFKSSRDKKQQKPPWK